MRTRAELEGIVLIAVSGFRSVARQSAIIRAKLRAGETIDSVLRVVAAPGYSEHHSGKAIDISTAGMPELTEAFERTPAYRWLASRAGSFGFRMSFPRGNRHGFSFEPWHWLFVGTRGKA
jgi:D-alanyl-D-alanine carboxypeptidase